MAARWGGADAVGMMGRFMGLVPDLETFLPVLGTSAAYGAGWAMPIVCRILALTRRATKLLSIVMHEGFGGLARGLDELVRFLPNAGGRSGN